MPHPDFEPDSALGYAKQAAKLAFDQAERLRDFVTKVPSPESYTFYAQPSEIAISNRISNLLLYHAYSLGYIVIDEVESLQTPI